MPKIEKDYILIRIETYKNHKNNKYEVELNQGFESLISYQNKYDAHNIEFKSEEDAMKYMLENNLYGEWICVPLFRLNNLE